MNETERMKELVKKLNEAAKAYYQEDREIMSNLEYDTLYDELQVLEEKTGVTLAGSPTTKVGYEAMDELPKEAHESPMLSLDKTKDVEVLRSFIGDHKTLLSWKMDGLTVVLTYRGGTLAKAVTRGNGVIESWFCAARRSSAIPILRRSTRRLRMLMRNTKIRGTSAAVLCAS